MTYRVAGLKINKTLCGGSFMHVGLEIFFLINGGLLMINEKVDGGCDI